MILTFKYVNMLPARQVARQYCPHSRRREGRASFNVLIAAISRRANHPRR